MEMNTTGGGKKEVGVLFMMRPNYNHVCNYGA